ncbi:MAG: Mor transcription activator family protein [Lamprobacter sp.]|uniref:Mor transcription activator family protein n=1 Tax=Lamprobacter sp. TaxID=3100796 RepID=UPI002B263218|nr:Mor transcription activator family protein [Lamprobacter sp.]MEA3641282.1 Mor transcription activator family protein [Lamprobacter sp.]
MHSPIDPAADLLATQRQALMAAVAELHLPLPPDHASALAERIERAIRHHHGGTSPYIPVLNSLDKHDRNSAIRRDYAQGRRLAEIAARYHLSESRVRQILAL